jgi:hypothetical protein
MTIMLDISLGMATIIGGRYSRCLLLILLTSNKCLATSIPFCVCEKTETYHYGIVPHTPFLAGGKRMQESFIRASLKEVVYEVVN